MTIPDAGDEDGRPRRKGYYKNFILIPSIEKLN